MAQETYQVFINHRGSDVKRSLANLIFHSLKRYGLSVFLDSEELRLGDTISSAIEGAIRSASVHIVIFSDNYAQSRWCLDELCWILNSFDEGNSKLIPVFWDVDPCDIRNFERGRFARAFQHHEDRGRVISHWKTAVFRVSQMSGVLFKANESYHGVELENIVNGVLEKVKLNPSEVRTCPVGLEQAVEDLNKIMENSKSNGTVIVGISGVAGLGKSTLAKYFYDLKHSSFSRSCFLSALSGARENDLLSFQHKLLRDLLGCNFLFHDTSSGKDILRQHLRGIRGLIVLDGVDGIRQIDRLLVSDGMGPGSLILITSRDQDLLKRSNVLYNVKPLQAKHAQELFCRHAFGQSEPYTGFEKSVQKYLDICGGVPLCLEVLGALLQQPMPDIKDWEMNFEKFSQTLPCDITNLLNLSYESLNETEKEMLLDIGCFFLGEATELTVRVLEGLGNKATRDSLQSLRKKCLVEYRDDGQYDTEIECRTEEPNGDYENLYLLPPKRHIITMHNHVREFVRNIAREEFRALGTPKPLRLISSNDIEETLQLLDVAAADSCRIRGIRTQQGQNFPYSTNSVKGVGVCLFVIEDYIDLKLHFSRWRMEGNLVWLRLRNFRSIYFPPTVSLGRLRVLELKGHGDLEQFFQRFNKPPWHLKVLDINVPDTDPSTSSGQRSSDFEHSKSRSISDSAQQGETASYLFRFLGYIGSSMNLLTQISLKNITSLQSLPIDFSKLKTLIHLDLSGCTNLTQLPKSFSELIHLQYLALRDCINLSIARDILGKISTLKYIDFKGCRELVELPEGIASQSSLKYLNLLCTHLRKIAPSLGGLNDLEHLGLGSIKLDRILLNDIVGPKINVLVIGGCPILENFSFEDEGTMHVGMGVLRDFTLKNTSISKICVPEGVFTKLETVDLSDNTMLIQVKGLPSTLVRLNLQKCTGLKTLTNLSNLGNLKFLCINGCLALETLNVEGLTSLEDIEAEECWELKMIEGLDQLERLNCLRISTNDGLIWDSIGEYLTSPSDLKLSTASFCGMADVKTMLDEAEMQCIVGRFKVEMVDILSSTATTSGFHMKLENFQSHGAILMCFITSAASVYQYCVRFDVSSYGGPTRTYRSHCGRGGRRSLQVFVWTENSDLFKDYRDYSYIDVYYSDMCANQLNAERVERGWMVMVDKKAHVWEVCRQFIDALA